MANKLGNEEIRNIVNASNILRDARISESKRSSHKIFRRMTIDLSTERTLGNPYVISFPTVAVYIEQATPSAKIKLFPFNDDLSDDYLEMGLKDAFNTDYVIDKLYITNEAQAGAKVVIVVSGEGEITSGSILIDSVKASEYSSSVVSSKSITNLSMTKILDSNLSRISAELSCSQSLYFSESLTGNEFPIGGNYTFKGSSEVWVRSHGSITSVDIKENLK